jgi:hypothetical protein
MAGPAALLPISQGVALGCYVSAFQAERPDTAGMAALLQSFSRRAFSAGLRRRPGAAGFSPLSAAGEGGRHRRPGEGDDARRPPHPRPLSRGGRGVPESAAHYKLRASFSWQAAYWRGYDNTSVL